jgi:hypothetical protein
LPHFPLTNWRVFRTWFWWSLSLVPGVRHNFRTRWRCQRHLQNDSGLETIALF